MARMGVIKNTSRILTWKILGSSRFGKPSKKLGDNIKTHLRQTGCEVDGSGIQWRAFAVSGAGLSGNTGVTNRTNPVSGWKCQYGWQGVVMQCACFMANEGVRLQFASLNALHPRD